MDNPALRPGALLQETFDLVKRHPLSLLAPLVILGIVSGAGSGRPNATWHPGQSPLLMLPFFALLGLVALIVIVLLFIAHCAAALMTTKAAFAASQQHRDLDIAESFREASPLVLPSIGTFLLYGLVLIVSFLLLVVPGFIALAGLLPMAAVIVAEGLQGQAALKRAWALTLGHKWNLFLSLLVLGLISVVASLLTSWIPIIGGAISGAISGAVFAAALVMAVCAYEHLRRDPSHHAGIVRAPDPMP